MIKALRIICIFFGYPKVVTLSYMELAERMIPEKNGPRSSALSWLAIDFILRCSAVFVIKKAIEKIYFNIDVELIDKDVYMIIMASIVAAFCVAMWSIISDYQKSVITHEYSIVYAFLSFIFSFSCMISSIYIYSLAV